MKRISDFFCTTCVLLFSLFMAACDNSGHESESPAEVEAIVKLVAPFSLQGYTAVFNYTETKSGTTEPINISVDPQKPNEGICHLPLLSNQWFIRTVEISQGEKSYTFNTGAQGVQIQSSMSLEIYDKTKQIYCNGGNLVAMLHKNGFPEDATSIEIGGQLTAEDFLNLKTTYYKLETITLFDQIALPASAFAFSTNLKKLIAPEVTTFGDQCFESTDRLTTLETPKVTSISSRVFRESAIEELNLPQVATVGVEAITGARKLQKVLFGKLTVLPATTFLSCTALKTVELPEATSLGEGTFAECAALESVNLPLINKIGKSIFQNCYALKSISLPLVMTVSESAFSGCRSLRTVEMPELARVDKSGFSECSSLEVLDFSKLVSIGQYAFSSCSGALAVHMPLLETADQSSFSKCSSLTEISLPKLNATTPYLFNECEKLKKVDLPNVTLLEQYSFFECASIETLRFPKVLNVKGTAFTGLASLREVDLPVAIEIRNGSFSIVPNLTTLKLGATSVIAASQASFYQFDTQNCDLYLNGDNMPKTSPAFNWEGLKWKSISLYQ